MTEEFLEFETEYKNFIKELPQGIKDQDKVNVSLKINKLCTVLNKTLLDLDRQDLLDQEQ